ncbi:MAG TPA: ribose-phosphate pyrophosphokinase [bacterium]|nr:ribose-phosphate pyrophosphokinase [bacterium]
MKVFSGNANRPLALKIVQSLGIELGKSEIRKFADGEISVKYNENIRGTDVFIIQPTCPPADYIMELVLMIDAAKRASAKRITAVIPYFGYARQDRKDQPRVALSAKLVANLISTAGADRVLTMDLHSASIQGFFDIPFDHLYSSTIFLKTIRAAKLKNLVVVAPDIGSSKRARAYANRLKGELALVDKKRSGPNQVETITLIGEVKGKDVIMVDDMIDTAGTLCKAARHLSDSGARRIIAACTHPILSNPAVERLEESKISKIIVSDTLLIPEAKKRDFIKIVTSADLFAEAIKRIHKEKSISSLFEE